MKDLDFDELDRAVNSLMSNVPKSAQPQPTEDKEKTLDITSTLDDGAVPSFDAIEKAASKAVTPTTASASPTLPKPRSMSDITPSRPTTPITTPARPQPASSAPAARRKFMDVVRPAATTKEPEKIVSRQGVTIKPDADAVAPETSAAKPNEMPQPAETPQETPAVSDVSSAASDWPDPLDMQPKKTDDVPMVSSESQEEKKETPETPTAESSQDDQNTTAFEPLTSPFLPDAKVEKRPLGGAALSEPVPEMPAPVADSQPKQSDSITEKAPEEAAPETPPLTASDEPSLASSAPSDSANAQMPEELSSDLIAVEADTTHDELKKAHDTAVSHEQPEEETENSAVVSPEADKKDVPVGPTSISQQYHESPSTGDKDSGSIYDTSTYHQPLASPVKKSSHRMLFLWIVVIVLVGAAAGAALYFSGII